MNKFRSILLMVTAIATVFTLGKSVVYPMAKTPQVKDFTFPEFVPLPQWKLSTNSTVKPNLVQAPAYIFGDFVSGKHYRYKQKDNSIDIEMRYFVNTDGDLKSFIAQQTGELLPSLRQDREGGFYSVFNSKDKAYLSACINSRGGSTITSDQFNRNRLIYDARLDRVVPWLLGKEKLQDRRCLWAHLSISLDDDTSPEEAYRTLETAWHDWYDWWRSRHFL